jgi:hypothetical protein
MEIAAADLVAGISGARTVAGSGTDQPALDRTAVQQYRERLAQLDEDLATPGPHDAIAEAERGWLPAELAARRSLHGQSRPFTDNGERARIAVTRAIRRALDRIERGDAISLLAARAGRPQRLPPGPVGTRPRCPVVARPA